MTQEEWHREAVRRFGEDPMEWKFVCPSCGYVASVRDWLDAGAPEGEIAFSCVGRRLGRKGQVFTRKGGPCGYSGGGLFKLNPVPVETGGKVHHVFAFAGEA